jgi:hypothetical protein
MTHNRLAGAASMVLGVGIAANALLGPLVFGVIKLRESANMENQLLGGELTSLLIAAPMAFAGGILWWRGNALAPFVAIGPAGFALYNYIQFVLVPDYSRYAGNNERFFPLYLTLVILAWALIWRAWNALVLVLRPEQVRRARRGRSAGRLLVRRAADRPAGGRRAGADGRDRGRLRRPAGRSCARRHS